MEERWSRLHAACLNCSTQRRHHHGKGYCKPCLSIMERAWRAGKWDRKREDTLQRMPMPGWWTKDAYNLGIRSPGISDWMSDGQFERYRDELIRQYREELNRLHSREQSRREKVTGWDVERDLRFVHAHIRPKSSRSPYHGMARSIDDQFTAEQLSVIHGLLLDLIDHVPWIGLDVDKLWKAVSLVKEGERVDDGPKT